MGHNFPRLLVATEFAPNAPGGGPAVVRQMLKKWPVEELCWWSCFSEQTTDPEQAVSAHRVAVLPGNLYPQRRYTRTKAWILENFWVPWAARHFHKTLKQTQPDVVWVIPHVWAIPPLAQILLKSKVRFHTTVQDYPDANNHILRLGAARAHSLAKLSDELYSHANTRDATSREMISDLHLRTQKDAAQVMHAGLEEYDFTYLSSKKSRHSNEIRIAYPGTIVVERDFELLVSILARIRPILRADIVLEFFGTSLSRSRPWFDPSWMREHGPLSAKALLQKLRECTWGLVLMGLSDSDPRYNRFSFPTKFITCLAAGLPMIVVGHVNSSLVEMAKRYPVGPVLTSSDPEEIEKELLMAFAIEDPWSRFGNEIQRCARAEFDATRTREALYECFRNGSGR